MDTRERLNESMQPQEHIEERWNIKRVIIGLIVISIVGVGGFFGKKYLQNHHIFFSGETENTQTKNVIGTHTEVAGTIPTPLVSPTISLPLKKDLEQKLEEIKKQVNSLNFSDIASSSPQVQKIMQDFKTLQDFPHTYVKDSCLKFCSAL